MVTEAMKPMDVGDDVLKDRNGAINPFCQDAYHMGVRIGTNVMIMLPNHDTERCNYLIVVDTITGERLRIRFGSVAREIIEPE